MALFISLSVALWYITFCTIGCSISLWKSLDNVDMKGMIFTSIVYVIEFILIINMIKCVCIS